jgi:hypothetical protein
LPQFKYTAENLSPLAHGSNVVVCLRGDLWLARSSQSQEPRSCVFRPGERGGSLARREQLSCGHASITNAVLAPRAHLGRGRASSCCGRRRDTGQGRRPACSAPSIKVGSQAATRRSRSRAGLLPPEGLADYGRCATVRDETGPVKGPPALVQQAMKEIVVVDHIGATPRKF